MSEVHRYNVVKMLSDVGNCISYDPHGPEIVMARDYDTALSKLAALREELGQCKGEYDRSANKVSALQDELAELEEEFDTLEHSNITLKQRLADAKQRNAELTQALERGKMWMGMFRAWIGDYGVVAEDHLMVIRTLKGLPHPPTEFDAALNKPEEAKS